LLMSSPACLLKRIFMRYEMVGSETVSSSISTKPLSTRLVLDAKGFNR
jgi:hypothetical protein